jgi:hypothetical protein
VSEPTLSGVEARSGIGPANPREDPQSPARSPADREPSPLQVPEPLDMRASRLASPIRSDHGPLSPEHTDTGLRLERAAWALTTCVFVVAGIVLLAGSYYGYGGVTLAVALAAALNLL